MKAFLKELWNRLWSETPKFFKKLRNFLAVFGTLSGLSSYAITGLGQLPYLPAWPWIEQTLRIMAFIGLVGAFIAQLTKVDKSNETQQ